jgi:hypothetical protein
MRGEPARPSEVRPGRPPVCRLDVDLFVPDYGRFLGDVSRPELEPSSEGRRLGNRLGELLLSGRLGQQRKYFAEGDERSVLSGDP